MYSGSDEIDCFVCDDVNVNWLAELQDILEAEGIPVELFCDTPITDDEEDMKPFGVKNGRLRLKIHSLCMDGATIKGVFKNASSCVAGVVNKNRIEKNR